jgi:hypothetical protein
MAEPWFRQLVTCLSPWRPEFVSKSVDLEFVVEKEVWDRLISKFFGFPCQYHFTGAPCVLLIYIYIYGG